MQHGVMAAAGRAMHAHVGCPAGLPGLRGAATPCCELAQLGSGSYAMLQRPDMCWSGQSLVRARKQHIGTPIELI